jgi:hypothetical protein
VAGTFKRKAFRQNRHNKGIQTNEAGIDRHDGLINQIPIVISDDGLVLSLEWKA